MKRRTLLILVVVLSLLFITTNPVGAASLAVAQPAQHSRPESRLLESTNTLPEGFHDGSEGQQIQFSCSAYGWVTDPDDRSTGLTLRILSDGIEVVQAVADLYRPDLEAADICTGGTCGFNVNLWGLISPSEDHLITVQAQDAQTSEWVDLVYTPRTLNCFEENFPVEGYHDGPEGSQNSFFCLAEGWVIDHNDLNLDLKVRILSDGVEVAQTIADRFRQDLDEGGACPGGTCSFNVFLTGLISLGADHSITVQAQDPQSGEWVDLNNTPKTLNCFEPQAQTFIVNSTGDLVDVVPGNGVCETSTLGECTLRAAIMESNANLGADTINFDIPGTAPYTISPSYGFDFISDPVTIDATMQPGFSGTPIIELDGSNAGPDAFGIFIDPGFSTVRGLAINRFALAGIAMYVNGGNIIQGNYIGTDLTGTISLGNGSNGIAITGGSGGNLIGGTVAGQGNLISGNGESGIVIADPGSTGNVIQGNLIGTDVTGTVDLGNHSGVSIGFAASDNMVGGKEVTARNIISGNECPGIAINSEGSTGNLVQGNYIGTDTTGTQTLGNGCEGIYIGSGVTDNSVGGNTTGAGNLISGNNGNGVTIDIGASGNLLQGNYIGTDVTGILPLGNTDDGVTLLASNNTIGGTTLAARNIISGNQEQGIRMQGSEASGNLVQGNFIGLDSTGTVALGNGTDCCHSGIVMHLGASNNLIGGSLPGAGNVISGNTADGVTIVDTGTTGNIVTGNFIGTDVTGTQALGNAFEGVVLADGASDNLVGGTEAGSGNVLSGNGANGVALYQVGTTGNLVQGNHIGTDVTGTIALGNSGNGVTIAGGASENIIGGTTAGTGNLISGNDGNGVTIIDFGTTENVLQGNYIGTDASGTALLANAGKGVAIFSGAANNLIGGVTSQERNIISGNSDNGIVIYGQGASANTVQGNYIGTDVSGTRTLGNIGYGIFIGSAAVDNTIGGLTAGTRNLISGNSEHGVGIFDDGTTGNVVQGNYIGTDASGTLPLGNARSGIALGDALNNTVGGTAVNAGNIIAFNNESGVVFYNASGNAIFSNSMHSNIGLGIDLGDDGVTANDLTDADGGPNNLQNFPIISSVQRKNKGFEIHGTLLSTPNTSFRLEFFSNSTCDPTGYGEGATYLGFSEVKTRITGLTTFKILLPALSTEGKFMTVTATDSAGNTSEFSPCVTVK